MMSLLVLVSQISPAPIAKVSYETIGEMSGIIKSAKYPGVFWVQNDSGNGPNLFAIKLNGSVVFPKPYADESRRDQVRTWWGVDIAGARNVDWEDLAYDGRNIYICDLGNNTNSRKDLRVYKIPEPDPNRSMKVAPVKIYNAFYPDQKTFPANPKRFDSEAAFFFDGKLYTLTKHRVGTSSIPSDSTTLRMLDTESSVNGKYPLKLVGEKSGLGGWVTGAAVSPSAKKFAVLTHFPQASVWIFPLTKGKTPSLEGGTQIKLQGMKQCEGICFDDETHVIINNEDRDLFRVTLP